MTESLESALAKYSILRQERQDLLDGLEVRQVETHKMRAAADAKSTEITQMRELISKLVDATTAPVPMRDVKP